MGKHGNWLVIATLLAAPASAGVDELQWLSGCWSADDQDSGSIEQWTQPAGGSMLGVTRTVRNGRTVFFEYLRIVDEADGSMTLIASPSGQQTARFSLLEINPREVIFENPAHDFPQRIAYRGIGEDRLLGHIEGTLDGEQRSIDFPMSRIACDDPVKRN